MLTGDKRQVMKKYSLGLAGLSYNYLQFNCLKIFFENSTDIRSESYWHQINCLVEW